MSYIKYDGRRKNGEKFYATKKRPNNQNNRSVLKKIADRLAKNILEDDGVELTELQEKFVKNVKNKIFETRKENRQSI